MAVSDQDHKASGVLMDEQGSAAAAATNADGTHTLQLSLFLMLLTFLQRNPDARQAGLNNFLFGQAATLLDEMWSRWQFSAAVPSF